MGPLLNRWRRRAAALTLTAALASMVGGSVHASSAELIACTAVGAVSRQYFSYYWVFNGKGSCVRQSDPRGTYLLSFSGIGWSSEEGTTINVCDGRAPVVRDPVFYPYLSLTNAATSQQTFFQQRWFVAAGVTTYPVVSPFTIGSNAGDQLGAGVFESHAFGNCAGSPAAHFQFSFVNMP